MSKKYLYCISVIEYDFFEYSLKFNMDIFYVGKLLYIMEMRCVV